MLIRFLVKNLFSFKELTEFNMLPGRFQRMPHHVYAYENIELLKLNAMYGANGAGKSNLIKAMATLSQFVTTGQLPIELLTQTFKLDKESKEKDVYLGIEFIKDEVPYYYGITINQGIVVEEELQISGLGKKEDYSLFLRTDKPTEKDLKLGFCKEIEEKNDASMVIKFLEKEVLERNQPLLYHLSRVKNELFFRMMIAHNWFRDDLVIVLANRGPSYLALLLEDDSKFREFANESIQSLNAGIEEISVSTLPINEYFGVDDKQEAQRITSELKANPNKVKLMVIKGVEVLFVWRNNEAVAKCLVFKHHGKNNSVNFLTTEESDGTLRLWEFLPAFYAAIYSKQVWLIDEIERSIHPLLIKELIAKFSFNTETKGQLIFSTHESNLLDQEIFRPDEIWFAEKNAEGATAFYPLSEFKEHHTIDIRKGYLNGRYGGIPFLGNLRDLNWEKYAEAH